MPWWFVLALDGCTKNEVKNDALAELDAYCKQIDQDYSAYNPPRVDWGPGYVFEAKIVGEGQNARLVPVLDPGQDEICRAIYPPALITQSSLSPPARTQSSEISAEAALQLLKGVVSDENKAKARLADLELTDELEIKWGNTSEHKFVREDLFDEQARPIAVNRRCFNVIQKTKEERGLANLWIITKSVATEELELTTESNRTAGAGMEIDLVEILDITAQADITRRSKNELVISAARFVCYQPPVRLADWIPTGRGHRSMLIWN